ncbi:SDR family NAD(P)-dependent oxidoreductase, partial [Methanobacterium sp.]
MKMEGNTILITGGATGIGLALTESLLKLGNEVIICGRREDKLIKVQNEHPGLHIRVCDVSDEESRKSLFKWVTENFKDLNVLINNAGIQ